MSGTLMDSMNYPVQYDLQFPEYKFKVGDCVTFTMRYWNVAQNRHTTTTYHGVVIKRKFFDDRPFDVRRPLIQSDDPYESEILAEILTGWRYSILVDGEWTTLVRQEDMKPHNGGAVSWEV